MKKYIEAITWFERSEYDIKHNIQADKKTIRVDLLHNDKVIKSDYTTLSTNYPQYVKEKILKIFEHFNP